MKHDALFDSRSEKRPRHAAAMVAPRRATARSRKSRPKRQRGAALITALLVVVLAAVLVSGLLWRQQVQIRRIENQRQSDQARWVSRGAFDWTRLVLRSEADSAPVTYLGGVWSVPIAETKLSDFLGKFGEARADQGASTWLSGSIEDAQSKLNLRNLAGGPGGSIDPLALAQLQKLLSLVGADSELAQAIAAQVRASLRQSATRTQRADPGNVASAALQAAESSGRPGGGFTDDPGLSSGDDALSSRPILMHSLDALLDVPGVTPDILERLAPFVTVLPVPTQINLNTAAPEVIAAAIPAMSLPNAQGFVQSRDQAFVLNLSDAQIRLQRFAPTESELDPSQFDVTSRFFIVRGRVRHERAIVNRVALIYRDPRNHSTHVMEVRDADGP